MKNLSNQYFRKVSAAYNHGYNDKRSGKPYDNIYKKDAKDAYNRGYKNARIKIK